MKKILSEKIIVPTLLLFIGITYFLISYFSEGTYDAGDGIRHYLVSRYSWAHPDLFLYSWGKPFFTLLSSPFSQFGLLGINVFNILCALFSAYICYKTVKLFDFKYPWLVIIFLCFTPCYFPTINSGLTEPLFGLVLIASIYLMFEEEDWWATVLVSFLPFVRNEGYFILPLFFIVLVNRRKYWTTLWLGFGTAAYSIIGFFYYKDFLWLIHQNPYDGKNKAFYGQGELFHFVKNYNFLWGSALTILLCFGIVALVFTGIIGKIYPYFKSKLSKEEQALLDEDPDEIPEEELERIEEHFHETHVLIIGSFLVYLIAHSVMWWQGWANSLGLLRVMAGVAPCTALICFMGLEIILSFIEKYKYVVYALIVISMVWVIRSPFKHEYYPYKLNPEEALIKEAGDWFQTSAYTKQKVYYLYPYLAHVLNVDSFDPNKVGELWGLYPSIKAWGIGAIPDSTIVFWDAHFGPNECHIPLDSMLNDPNFQLIKTFKPAVPFTVLGGYPMEVNVFIKLHEPKKMDVLQKELYDLESLPPTLLNTTTLFEGNNFSGKHLSMLSPKNEYSVTVKKLVSEIPPNTKAIDFNFKLFEKENNSKEAVVVISVDNAEGKNLLWNGNPIVLLRLSDVADGGKVSTHFTFNPNSFPKDATVKLYVWNKKLKEFYIDDLEVEYLGFK